MISKSQFVIFSALLAYQGMVGAGGDSAPAAAQASAPAPNAPAAPAKAPAAPKPETYEDMKKRLTTEYFQARKSLDYFQDQFDQKKLSVDILERIIAAGEEGDNLTWELLGKTRISIARDLYARAKAKLSESKARLERLTEDADQFYKSIEENAAVSKDPNAAEPKEPEAAGPVGPEAAGPEESKAAVLWGAFSSWKGVDDVEQDPVEGSVAAAYFFGSWRNVKNAQKDLKAEAVAEVVADAEESFRAQEAEVTKLLEVVGRAVERYAPKNRGKLAGEVAQLRGEADQARTALPEAKKALAEAQVVFDLRKGLADKAHAELEKAIADKTIADENKKRADQDAAKKKADADKNKNAAVTQGATPVVPAADNKTKAEEEAKKLPPSAAAPAPVTTIPEFKALEKEEKAKVVETLVKVLLGDNPDAKEKTAMEKELNTFLGFPGRAAKLVEYLKKLTAESSPAETKETKGKKLRRLANDDKKDGKKENKPKEADPMVQVIGQTAGEALVSLAQLQKTHGDKFQNVKDQTTYAAFKADAKKTGDAISKAEAVIKLREDNTAKADDLKKAKATVLGLGLGLGLGIPVLAAVVFTVLVKTNRVLLNFGSSATVSADV